MSVMMLISSRGNNPGACHTSARLAVWNTLSLLLIQLEDEVSWRIVVGPWYDFG